MADEKKITTHSFIEGANSDITNELLSSKAFRRALNFRVFGNGTKGKGVKVMGNTLIANALPSGNNKGHGWGVNEEAGKLYLFNYNDQGYHGIYAYDIITGAITPVLLNKTDTNGVDILKFDPNYPIYHVDIVADNLLYWVDGLNKARKTNIAKCIDKSSTGYGTIVTEDLITAYKQTAIYPPNYFATPASIYFTDGNRRSNYLYGLQFKFATRFYYADGEQSNVSDYSSVPLPPNEGYLGQSAILFDNNCIKVTVETGSRDVSKVEILVKIGSADFASCIILNKADRGIGDYGSYTYLFYNDGAYNAVDPIKVARPYSFLPDKPYTQCFVKTAMLYGNFSEGFSPVKIIATSAVTFKPFYLPSGTVSQLNNPVLTAALLSSTEHGGVFNSWWTTVTHFVVGNDVKKGNVFTIIARGGNTSPTTPQNFSYTATLSDTATTVASQIKAYLRLIDAVGQGSVSNENIDGFGNVSWDFTIEAHESKQPIIFTPSVTPINYSTLLDNGLSVNTIKQGSSRKYGIVYDDGDGRTSLTYTVDTLLTVTPFETETILGQTAPIGLQQPVHMIKIFNQPPLWAKYWRLVRTSDTKTFIQMLIQRVNDVVVANQPTYIDMVVGSLLTYQKIHPDTILQYEFKRGDRLRLISNENTVPPTPYTPYFETEVLSYTIDEQIPVNANIRTTIGTPSSNVTPSDGPKLDYVGKNIIIQGTERTIVSVSGADYVLDQPITLQQATTATLYTVPNYTIVDRRGIIRIKKPVGYTITDRSLVEIYSPQQNIDNASYLDFFDFQQKFSVSNPGTSLAAHIGNVQNQDGSNPATTPAIVQVTNGDAYVRNRALPTNNQDPNPQVIIDQICDPNFSDFYKSDLYNSGRVYPQDQAYGVVYFGSRIRFSNNYIEGTRINGLNDFDNTDREDYDDPYGTITLLRFKRQYLRVFKQLRTAWTPVKQRVVADNQQGELLTTSDKLLNDLQYAEFEGGIGNHPECYIENANSEYIVSVDSGVILRIAQDGSLPISTVYQFDKVVRDLLSYVSKYNLKIPGGFDRQYDDAIWSVDDFVQYIFNNAFNAGDWQTVLAAYPSDTTWTVTQQPANATATVVGNQIQITGTSTLGADLFKFRGNLSAGVTTPVMNLCFNVVAIPNRSTIFAIDPTTAYCEQVYGNSLRSQNFTRNNCGPGYVGSTVSYTVAANTYKADTQAGADALAQADIDANGQNYANDPAHGTCTPLTVYSNARASAVFTRNNCATGYSGTTSEYVVAAGTYTSTISQVAADNQASADISANGQNYANDPSHGSCILTSLVGTLLVDYYNDTDGDICFYCHTFGTSEYDIPVTAPENNTGSGVSRYPNDGRDPSTCYLLSSNRLTSGTVAMRFGINMAYFISQYPAIDRFTFIMRGRSVTAQGVIGIYALRNVSQGHLIMPETSTGSGKYIPSVSGATTADIRSYSSNVVNGASAGHDAGISIGSPILQLEYVVSTNTLTKTTY